MYVQWQSTSSIKIIPPKRYDKDESPKKFNFTKYMIKGHHDLSFQM